MKAITQERYGSADRLALTEIPRPAVGPDDVLVRVRAAGLDRGIWHEMTGLPYAIRLFSGLRRPRVAVRGRDLAGVVEAVGARVSGFRPGDEVFGAFPGAFAEFVRVRPGRIAPTPAGLSFAQAAALPASAVTALHAVRDKGRIRAGQRVLVIGASGGVGTFAVQIAKAAGAHVTGVGSTAKLDLIREIGADDVLDYTREELSGRYDVILDIAGNRRLSLLRSLLVRDGILVAVGGEDGGRWTGGMGRSLGATLLSPFVSHHLRPMLSIPDAETLAEVARLVASGAVTPAIDRTYPLAEVPDAMRYLESGQVRGKVVIIV